MSWQSIYAQTKLCLDHNLRVVIDFIAEDEAETVIKNLKEIVQNSTLKYAVLIASEECLKDRLLKRGDIRFLERSFELLRKLSGNPINKSHLLETDDIGIDDLVKELMNNESLIV